MDAPDDDRDGPTPPRSASSHPATWKFGYPIHHAETTDEWRQWLAAHAGEARGVWLASWRAETGRPCVPYDAVVEEALCWGWIDSTVNTLDERRRLMLVTPRKARSTWSRSNKRRIAKLEREGRLTPAGRRAVEVAKANGWWTIYDAVEDLVEPDDLAAALDAEPTARATWDGFPPSARKLMLWWVISAVRDDTRRRRVTRVVEEAAAGRRAQG